MAKRETRPYARKNELHTQQAPMSCSRDEMSHNKRRKALRYLMFLKEKRDGTIKAQGYTDG